MYCLGLGLPFIAVAFAMDRGSRMLDFLRKHRLALMRIGGGLLILIGIALVSGLWGAWVGSLQGLIGGFEAVVCSGLDSERTAPAPTWGARQPALGVWPTITEARRPAAA